MIGEIARRSLAKAAMANAELKAAASGNEAGREAAIQMLRRKADAAQVSYDYTLPQNEGGELISALLSVGQYKYKSTYSNSQLAIAGTMIAADLINTAGFDPPTVYRNLDTFVRAASTAGAGFCDPFRLALAPWFAAVARRNGVDFDKNQLVVFHEGWKLETDATQDEVNQALENAANFQSFLQLVSYKVNAFDVQMTGTRRCMCVAFLIRSFFAFFIQLPSVVIPNLDVDAQMIHSLGSVEWDSDTEDEDGPDVSGQSGVEEYQKKRSKSQMRDKPSKKEKRQEPDQVQCTSPVVFGPENKAD